MTDEDDETTVLEELTGVLLELELEIIEEELVIPGSTPHTNAPLWNAVTLFQSV